MSNQYGLAIFCLLIICAFLAALAKDVYPGASRIAWALLGSALILFSVESFIGTLTSLATGDTALASRVGSIVTVHASSSPSLFWTITGLKIVGELIFLAGGVWALIRASKSRRAR